MQNEFGDINDIEIGCRLRLAREKAGIKQADAALAIEVARTTLISIENGQRRVRMNELRKLARTYDTSVNALMANEVPQVNLIPQFRKLPACNDDNANEAVQAMSDLVIAEQELEKILGIARANNYPPERPILAGDVQAQAEQDALDLRQRIGIGNAPIFDMKTLLEMELGLHVYVCRISSKISGLYAYDESLGPCVLLNANHPRQRRNQTAAHELGHFISIRKAPEITVEAGIDNSRSERYANTFARSFLTPTRAVSQKFCDLLVGSDRLTRRHVIILANFFSVSREAMVRRLEELKLVKEGTWDWFVENGGITDEQERNVLGNIPSSKKEMDNAEEITNIRLNLLASEAYRQELLSESQLSRLLRVDRIELRGIIDAYDQE